MKSEGLTLPEVGDFATGMHAIPAEERVVGDFATGMRSDAPVEVGTFAIGQLTEVTPVAERVGGTFASSESSRAAHPLHVHAAARLALAGAAA